MKIEKRNYKDTVFRMLFRDKVRLLELYNAINSTSYQNPDDIEFTTLEGNSLLNMKNDVSFVIGYELSLYEHQSSQCTNIPLRDLFYVASIYKEIVPIEKTYGSRMIKIKTPKFFVFYNGTHPMEDRTIYRLSDMFEHKSDDLELKVTVLNINEGHNKSLMETCKTIEGYSLFVSKVRKYIEEEKNRYQASQSEKIEVLDIDNETHKNLLETAINRAIEECIEEDVLKDFFVENRKEVVDVGILGYNAEKHLQFLQEESYDAGLNTGLAKGIEKGTTRVNSLNKILIDSGRIDDLTRATTDPAFQEKLIEELVPTEIQQKS